MLKIILFSFMENGYLSLRNIEKSCKTDISYMWLLDGMAAPSFTTLGNFIRDELNSSIEDIFLAINQVIFEKVTELLEQINSEELSFLNVKFETRNEYAIEYLDDILKKYADVYRLNPNGDNGGNGDGGDDLDCVNF